MRALINIILVSALVLWLADNLGIGSPSRSRDAKAVETATPKQRTAEQIERDNRLAEENKIISMALSCQYAIEKSLNDPESAKFDIRESAYIDNGGGAFSLAVPFRAKNQYGAYIRAMGSCDLRHSNEDWQVISHSFIAL